MVGAFICVYDLLRLPPTILRRATLLGAQHGTFLATRWEADDDDVNLYHCADEGCGFFVEVDVDYGQEQPVVLRSFVTSVPLEDYSYGVQLPEL